MGHIFVSSKSGVSRNPGNLLESAPENDAKMYMSTKPVK